MVFSIAHDVTAKVEHTTFDKIKTNAKPQKDYITVIHYIVFLEHHTHTHTLILLVNVQLPSQTKCTHEQGADLELGGSTA